MSSYRLEPELGSADEAASIDRLCDQFEAVWKARQVPRIEDYLRQVGEGPLPLLLRELLLLELDYRGRVGEHPTIEEYHARFPDHCSLVDAVFPALRTAGPPSGAGRRRDLDPVPEPRGELHRSRANSEAAEETATLERCSDQRRSDEKTQSLLSGGNGAGGQAGGGDPPRAAASPRPGVPERIGKYAVIELLDEGGQSIVYRALDPDLKREVVIKLNRTAMSAGASNRDALLEQGKLVARLEHPHLDRVYELGFHEGRPFLVMQYASGLNLTQRLSRQPMTRPQQAALVAQLGRAVAAAHAQGIIHRDIKPANIMVDEAGQPRLIDFGLAWLRDVWVGGDDEAVGVSGTPQYMAPEQARGEAADHRSDIFALGAVLYLLLTGSAPFSAANRLQSLKRARACEFDHAALSGRGIPRRLRQICLRAMQARLDARYQTATDLAKDLERYVRGRPYWIYAAAVAAAVLVVAGIVRFTSRSDLGSSVARPDESPSPQAKPGDPVPAVTPPSGKAEELQIWVWQNDRSFPLHEAVPLRSGDDLRIEWRLLPGHFGTLFWFDTEGGLNQLSATGPGGPEPGVTLQWPGPGKSNVLAGPPGTEVIFLCTSTSAPPRLEEVESLLTSHDPWPELTGPSLLVFDRDQVELQGPQLRGPSATSRERPEERVRLRADALRQRLTEKFQVVKGVAFGHVEQKQ